MHLLGLLTLLAALHEAAAFKPHLYELVRHLLPQRGENYQDMLTNGWLSLLTQTDPANENGTRWEFEQLALTDRSNDEIAHASVQEIIKRSGFDYQLHESVSDDGYVTQLVRLVNPLADRNSLKKPPVVLHHGGIIDSTCWLWASAIQHHPEVWPRDFRRHGPITSSNRSLAFALANRGFDVWLAPTRGSNSQQQAHRRFRKVSSDALDFLRFWTFNFDDLIKHELPRQLELVLSATGAQRLSVLGFSLSGPTTLGLLASSPRWNGRVHNLLTMAPLLDVEGGGRHSDLVFRHTCHQVQPHLGVLTYTRFVMSQATRRLVVELADDPQVRYLLVRAFASMLLGPSAKYNTFFEKPVLGHLLMPTSYFTLLHGCQLAKARRLQHFDHGLPINLAKYGQPRPPPYELANIRPKHWMLITGGQDVFFSPVAATRFLESCPRKPDVHLHAPHFNHLDLVAAFENGRLINLPIIDFLERHQL